METIRTHDEKKAEAFAGRLLADVSATTTTALSSIGDRLGLWKALADGMPRGSEELARRLELSERHVREWLHAMAAAGYLERQDGAFRLPPEHVPALAQEEGPSFFGGVQQNVLGYVSAGDRVLAAFRTGGGVPQSAYPEGTYAGMERFTASWFENLLVPVWLPAAGLVERLRAGIDVADVGCGRGRALIRMAREYPRSRFTGFDVYGPNVEKARRNAQAAGVGDRVRFEERDAAEGLPGSYDLVTTFDVVHDAADPGALVRAIRRSLRPGGTFLCLEIRCSHDPAENAGPLGALFYGCSLLYCMVTSLAHGGAGLGTCGLPPREMERLGSASGFSRVETVPLQGPFHNLFRLSP